MLIAAHIFAGALLGLVFWYLAGDRRVVPLCMAGAILPDLIDKPLGLVFPTFLSGGRTIFHGLAVVLLILLCVFIMYRSGSRWLGAGVAGAVLLHQVLDEMWTLPANWFWPLLGPFQGQMIPGYIWTYLRLELTNPSEWLFLIGSAVILAGSYRPRTGTARHRWSGRGKTVMVTASAVVFSGAGIYLLIAGLIGLTPTFIAPGYDLIPTVFAGILALCGAGVLIREHWGQLGWTAGSG